MDRSRKRVWMLSLALGIVYLVSGWAELVGVPPTVELFHRWGYSDVFRLLVGVVEVGGALTLLIPRVATIGALLLSMVMVGAVYTHLFRGHAVVAVVPLGMLLLLLYVGKRRLGEPMRGLLEQPPERHA